MANHASTRGVNGRRPVRKRPAHPPVHEPINRPVVVFVTLCTHQRRPVLACSFMHDLLRAAWHETDYRRVGRYVVMPDHLHLFCAPGRSWRESGIVGVPGRTEHPDVA
jgi:hypothetical protein